MSQDSTATSKETFTKSFLQKVDLLSRKEVLQYDICFSENDLTPGCLEYLGKLGKGAYNIVLDFSKGDSLFEFILRELVHAGPIHRLGVYHPPHASYNFIRLFECLEGTDNVQSLVLGTHGCNKAFARSFSDMLENRATNISQINLDGKQFTKHTLDIIKVGVKCNPWLKRLVLDGIPVPYGEILEFMIGTSIALDIGVGMANDRLCKANHEYLETFRTQAVRVQSLSDYVSQAEDENDFHVFVSRKVVSNRDKLLIFPSNSDELRNWKTNRRTDSHGYELCVICDRTIEQHVDVVIKLAKAIQVFHAPRKVCFSLYGLWTLYALIEITEEEYYGEYDGQFIPFANLDANLKALLSSQFHTYTEGDRVKFKRKRDLNVYFGIVRKKPFRTNEDQFLIDHVESKPKLDWTKLTGEVSILSNSLYDARHVKGEEDERTDA